MTVSLKIGRQILDIDLDSVIEVNNRLSAQYKTEPSQEKRRELIAILYRLNLPLFRRWKLFDFEEKQDYEQEAFFWISRALDTFDPTQGAFLHWLKTYYTRKAIRQYLTRKKDHQNALDAAPAFYESEDLPEDDALFWEDAKALLGEGWAIIHPVIVEGKTLSDLAKILHLPRTTLDYRYRKAMESLRTHLVKWSSKAGTLDPTPGEGEWLGPKKFCKIMDISRPYLQNLLNPDRPATVCPYYINPLHYTPLQGGRIRYLFTPSRGLVYPEILRKKPQ